MYVCDYVSLSIAYHASGVSSRSIWWKHSNSLLYVLSVVVVGEPMVAVSWQEMMCPSTEQKEMRKVAKVA